MTDPATTRRRRRNAAARTKPLALLYVRVSTTEQAEEGASLAAQLSALRSLAAAHGWDTRVIEDAGASGKSLDRDGMQAALRMLTEGEADIIAATRLDRLSRDLHDISGLIKRSVDEGWSLVTIHGSIDTGSAMGRAYVQMSGLFAELERGMISERTKAGMAQRKADGGHMGRRTGLPPDVIARVRELRNGGLSWPRVAQTLTDEGVPTATGRTVWSWSSARSALTVNPSPPPARVRDTA
jgi:DNA invertase Pin-like site-specific DNA recombinase